MYSVCLVHDGRESEDGDFSWVFVEMWKQIVLRDVDEAGKRF